MVTVSAMKICRILTKIRGTQYLITEDIGEALKRSQGNQAAETKDAPKLLRKRESGYVYSVYYTQNWLSLPEVCHDSSQQAENAIQGKNSRSQVTRYLIGDYHFNFTLSIQPFKYCVPEFVSLNLSGGGTYTGPSSGAGAAGECIVTTW